MSSTLVCLISNGDSRFWHKFPVKSVPAQLQVYESTPSTHIPLVHGLGLQLLISMEITHGRREVCQFFKFQFDSHLCVLYQGRLVI